ncbi:hypothetical protein VQ042_19610 [Aurantimonas sp. A2-1-M11]|uniref:hypothetical protein n=1 Tax=Aurantimonas sp. A2-1-M11 TaxID=3113712 RepID=UPI002F928371
MHFRIGSNPRATLLSAAIVLALQHPAAAQVDLPVMDGEPGAELVEVSLGDWNLKTALASDLGIKASEIPLTISVSPELAGKVCPVSREDLAQQEVISPTRTCAAKEMTAELRDEVRRGIADRPAAE